jgi:murein DD-endopeptidase MepM/ murein hydrolase activator NlpD
LKLLSDLRLNNTQVSEQFTALILAGVAAVVIGGVAHMGAYRHQAAHKALPSFAPSRAVEDFSNSQPIVRSVQDLPLAPAPIVTAIVKPVVAESTVLPTYMMSGTLPPIVLAPVVTPWIAETATALEQIAAKPENIVRTAEITRSNALQNLLSVEADLENAEVTAITKALAAVYKGKYPRGLEVSLRFTRRGDTETFEGLVFQPEPTLEVKVARLADGSFKAEKIVTPLERQRNAVAGTIRTTLIEAGLERGVPRSVMAAMVRAFSHEVDFQRDVRPGDKFRVLYDQPYSKSGQPIGNATIIYAAIEAGSEKHAVFRVIYNDGTSEYFNDQGESVRRGLMRTPIDGAHVTSSFGMRRHPIMGYSKFHQGVDFAAPQGTPVLAAGDGVVQDVGYRSGYGNFILVRHRTGLETAYAHMSRFARGISKGDTVNQGDIIAYVGSTGRSTGPHLHFEVRVDGQAINPMKVNMQAGSKLSGKGMAQFRAGKVAIEAEFRRRALTGKPEPMKLAAAPRGPTAKAK